MAAPPPKIFAVLVGINEYLGQKNNLSGCLNDVETVKEFLMGKLHVPNSRIHTLTSPPQRPGGKLPTRVEVEALIRNVAKDAEAAGPNSLLFVHYSGHGARVKTRYPHLQKGTYDEALCTLNEDWRDVEVSKTLDELTKTGLTVLVVLDCCHSGGADRGDDSLGTVRTPHSDEETKFDDEPQATDLPTSNTEESSNGGGRDAVMKKGWFYTNRKHNLIAACQPHELAREQVMENSKKKNGVLTYFLRKSLDTLHRSSSPVTYDKLMSHLVALCEGTPTHPDTRQQPMHLGQGQRLLFGKDCILGSRQTLHATVERVTTRNGAKYAHLDRGESHGVGLGDEFRLYAPEQSYFGSLTSKAQDHVQAKVVSLDGTKSKAIITLDTRSQAAAGWFSTRTKRGALPIVAMEPHLGTGFIKQVREELDRVVSDTQGPLFSLKSSSENNIKPTITIASDGTKLKFLDSKNHTMDHIPPVKLHEANIAMLVRYLVCYLIPHLCSYQALVDLHPTKIPPSVRPEFDFEVKKETVNDQDQDLDDDLDLQYSQLRGPAYRVIFKNRSTSTLYASVFNLGQAYAVKQMIPTGGASSLSVDPDTVIPTAAFYIVVPELLKAEARKPGFTMRDVFKVLVTARKTDFGRYDQNSMIDFETWKCHQIGHPARDTSAPLDHKREDFWVQSVSITTTAHDIVFPDRDEPDEWSDAAPGPGGPSNISSGQGDTNDAVDPSAEMPDTVEIQRSTVLDHNPAGWESD